MTAKAISALTAAGSFSAADLLELQRRGRHSVKLTGTELRRFLQNHMVGNDEGIAGTIGASETRFGGTVYPVSPSIVMKAGTRLVIEAELYRLTTGNTSIYVSIDGTNYYRVADQSDGNMVNYYQGGVVGSATGASTNRNYTGVHFLGFELLVPGASNNYIATKIDEQRLPDATSYTNHTTNNMVGTLTVYIVTDDASKSSVRFKLLG